MKISILANAAALALLLMGAPARAEDASRQSSAQRRAALETEKAKIQAQIDALDQTPQIPPAPVPGSRVDDRAPEESGVGAAIVVTARSTPLSNRPLGQTVAEVPENLLKDAPIVSVGDILKLAPGVTFTQGNGPRDVSISVRGSNERQTYAIRNVQVFEDGFPVTQPDGTARSDLIDPHAYTNASVIQGPSSALFGNYATGGAIDFETRPGGEINGAEAGFDIGGYGYLNGYAMLGGKSDRYEYSAFVSGVRGDGFTSNNGYDTITENVLARVSLTPHDRVTFKFINNDLDTDLSLRLSLNQFKQNPFQTNCATTAVVGCAGVTLLDNGYNGATTKETASAVDLGRHDRRTIVGARYEHDLDAEDVWTTTFVFDNRDIRQPTSGSDYRGTYPSFNIISDVTRRAELLGRSSSMLVGGFFNYENINSTVFNVLPAPGPQDGGLTQTVDGSQLNAGLRAREELALTPELTAVAGVGAEYTELLAVETNLAYPLAAAPFAAVIDANRTFFNVAPEGSLIFRPDETVSVHARISTGYGTPQATNLFVTPQGVFGNNTQLKTQTNKGLDVGVVWSPDANLRLAATAFYEWFENELVTQSAGVNLQSYTFNAPRSEHRGAELGLDWRPAPKLLPGARIVVSYLYDDQIYTAYAEQLSSGALTSRFNRSGEHIPGVAPNFGAVRLIYDEPEGVLMGVGGYLEATGRGAYPLDNANLIAAPGYVVVNLNLHYDPPARLGLISRTRFYIDVQNLLNQRYIASASNITDGLNGPGASESPASVLAGATGSIYAGQPITIFGGVRVKF